MTVSTALDWGTSGGKGTSKRASAMEAKSGDPSSSEGTQSANSPPANPPRLARVASIAAFGSLRKRASGSL